MQFLVVKFAREGVGMLSENWVLDSKMKTTLYPTQDILKKTKGGMKSLLMNHADPSGWPSYVYDKLYGKLGE